jgi:hypothetical protein
MILERLGKGGNAYVYRATDGAQEVALKVLKTNRPDSEPYARFRNEIEIVRRFEGDQGVLPILDHSLPERPRRSSSTSSGAASRARRATSRSGTGDDRAQAADRGADRSAQRAAAREGLQGHGDATTSWTQRKPSRTGSSTGCSHTASPDASLPQAPAPFSPATRAGVSGNALALSDIDSNPNHAEEDDDGRKDRDSKER